MLTFIRRHEADTRKGVYQCECGGTVVAWPYNVKSGNTRSCGCLRRAASAERSTTHGHKRGRVPTTVYGAWMNMRMRCDSPNVKQYADYGGRGIHYDPRWVSFAVFLADMGEPKPGESLDRIDVNGPYYPGNCRWADRKTQMRNKRTNRVIEHGGESLTLVEWAERSGVGYATLMKRLDRGIPMDLALQNVKYLRVNR